MSVMGTGSSTRSQTRFFSNRALQSIVFMSVALLLAYMAFRRWTEVRIAGVNASFAPSHVSVSFDPDLENGTDNVRRKSKDPTSGTTCSGNNSHNATYAAERDALSPWRGPRVSVDGSWVERRSGLWVEYLRGKPSAVGRARGLLTAGLIENDIVADDDIWARLIGTGIGGWWRGNVSRWQMRGLVNTVAPEHLLELSGLCSVFGTKNELPQFSFQAFAQRHVLPEFAGSVPLEQEASRFAGLAFAAWGNQTRDGSLLVGRTWEMPHVDGYDARKRIVSFVYPQHGIPFVSVSWPGNIGVVTGVNRARMFVALNVARSDEGLRSGAPGVFGARLVLEHAQSIDEAVALIRKQSAMNAFSLLVADGKVPTAVVIEVTPDHLKVRKSSSQMVAATNHLVHKQFKADASNDRTRRYTASGVRYERIQQLLRRFGRRLDADTVAMVLRNRTGINDKPRPLGYRAAIDSLGAVHGVVVDLKHLVLWVTEGPFLLGPMAAFDLKPAFGMSERAGERPKSITADPLLDSMAYQRLRFTREQMEYARRFRERVGINEAIVFADRALQATPDLPQAQLLFADLLWAAGRTEEAKTHYKQFVASNPSFRTEGERAERRLTY